MNITIWSHNSRFLRNVGKFLAFHIALPTRKQHCSYSRLTFGYLWFSSFRQLLFATSLTASLGSQCFSAWEIKLFWPNLPRCFITYFVSSLGVLQKLCTHFPKLWEAPFECGTATFSSLSQTYWALGLRIGPKATSCERCDEPCASKHTYFLNNTPTGPANRRCWRQE